MTAELGSTGTDAISFVNRDHIVLVTIKEGQIAITTTIGATMVIPASADALATFIDELANHVESNFVSIVSAVDSNRIEELK